MTELQDLQVAYVAVGDVRPSPTNARTHPRKQVDQMIEALRALRVEDDQKIEDIMTEMETGKISGSQGLRLIKEINGEL